MALINCPECSRKISSSAYACPHCGYPIGGQKSSEENSRDIFRNDDDANYSDDPVKVECNKSKSSKNVFVTALIAVAVIASILVALITALPLGTKTGEKPDDVSNEHYSYGKRALDIIDQYLDNEIDARTAKKRLDNLIDYEWDKLPDTPVSDKTHNNGFYIEQNVVSCSIIMTDIDYGTGSQNELLEHRNKIAEILNETKR